jgi:hypothetical protein
VAIPRAVVSLVLVSAVLDAGCLVDRSPLRLDVDGGPVADAPGLDAARSEDDAWTPTDAGCREGSTRCTMRLRERCEGGAWVEDPCLVGCVADGDGARCLGLVPSNVGGAPLPEPSGPAATLSGSLDTGTCDAGEVRGQGDGEPELCVRRFDGPLTLGPLDITGTRALVLLVSGSVEVIGELRSLGALSSGGPGGGDGASDDVPATGVSPGGNGEDGNGLEDGGGGGGGSCGRGAAGGDSGSAGLRGTAGVAYPDGYLLSPLRGGSGGGRGALRGSGGGGGGALQISALGPIRLDARVVVGGGPGGGGDGGSNAAAGAGGGGGGGVLLESGVSVRYGSAAEILASGGGGGGGGSTSNTGGDGDPGDRAAPLGGRSGGFYGGTGGNGGTGGSRPAQEGGTNGSPSNGGGGGGGAGCVVVRAPDAAATPGTGIFRSAAPRIE